MVGLISRRIRLWGWRVVRSQRNKPRLKQLQVQLEQRPGVYGFGQSGLGPTFMGFGGNAGMVMNIGCGGPTPYAEFQPLNYGLDAGWRLRAGAAAGVEATFY